MSPWKKKQWVISVHESVQTGKLSGTFAGDVFWGPWDSTVNWTLEETWAPTFPDTVLLTDVHSPKCAL